MNLKLAFLLFFLSASGFEEAAAQSVSMPESENVAQVWSREADYWRFVEAGDVENYVSLWHDKFIGWPCGADHPTRKASIGDWVREFREKRIHVVSSLTREGAEDFGNVVVVHYRFTLVETYQDGKIEGEGEESKITHTWIKAGDSWLIIGGMCGTYPDSAT